MQIERRRTLATAATALLPDIERAVVDSWPDLLPASTQWSEASMERAHRAARAALEGLVQVIERSDLDDRAWRRLRAEVSGHGHATAEEVDEMLRSVRVVGVELLADRLQATVGLSTEERWELQAQAGWFGEQLAGSDDILEITDDALLGHLHDDGADVA